MKSKGTEHLTLTQTPRILFFDIETTPCLAWVWNTGKQVVRHNQILDSTKIICISYKWIGESKVHSLKWDRDMNDKALLQAFTKVADEADLLIGHNGDSFDIKHVNARIAYHKLPPISTSLTDDTLKLVRRKLKLVSYKLDYLGQFFGLGNKLETGGYQLWLDIWRDNNRQRLSEMVEYCAQDVNLLEKVYLRLRPYLPVKANYGLLTGDRVCPKCGSCDVIKNGTRQTSKFRIQQRWQCKNCGSASFTNKSDDKNLRSPC